MSVEVRAIREEEREECWRLWCTVWPSGTGDYFRRYFYGDVEWLPYYTQVAVVDGKIVSAVQICKRTVPLGDFRLTMGGIANVATLPEYRGQGYNTQCMQAAIRVMEADAMDFSLLFTGIPDYYARQGYATLSRASLGGAIRPDFAPRPSRFAVRQAVAEDLPGIRDCYRNYNRARPIAVERTEAYWRDWIGISEEKIPEGMLVACDAAGQVIGYVRSGKFNSAIPYSEKEVEVRIIEFGTQPALGEAGETEAAQALLDAATANMRAAGAQRLRLDIAFEPPVLQALEGVLQTPEWTEIGSGMARLLHRTNLLTSLTMEWNERWQAAGRPPGRLAFATPYGPIALDASRTFLRVEPKEDAGEALPQSTLFGLLFGNISPAQATKEKALHPLIATLFPRRSAVYWGADGF